MKPLITPNCYPRQGKHAHELQLRREAPLPVPLVGILNDFQRLIVIAVGKAMATMAGRHWQKYGCDNHTSETSPWVKTWLPSKRIGCHLLITWSPHWRFWGLNSLLVLARTELLEWIKSLCLGTSARQGRGQLYPYHMAAEKSQLQRVQHLWAFVLEVLRNEPSPSVNISLYKALYYLPLHSVRSLIVLGKEEVEGGTWKKPPETEALLKTPQLDGVNDIKGTASLALATQEYLRVQSER